MRRSIIIITCLFCCLWTVSCSKTGVAYSETGDIKPETGATVYGMVSVEGKPLSGVAVSDGVDIVTTGKDGIYHLPSAKKNGLVFISMPSGYRIKSSMALYPFWRSLKKDPDIPERVDFELISQVQNEFTLVAMPDIQLFSNSSASAFTGAFVNELNRYVKSNSSIPIYGITLGDMTWDWFWYANDFGIERYIACLNTLRGIPVFHTVGNHDCDMQYNSLEEFQNTGEDWTCMRKYRSLLGPTCFSYNIGGVHFVSLDNVITTNTGGTDDKNSRGCWRGVTAPDMEWLKKDLALVSAQTPVVVSLHIPLINRYGEPGTTDQNSLSVNTKAQDIVAPFAKFKKILVLSGHSHILYNVARDISGVSVTEWNSGAICGDFWTTATNASINVCTDGTPGGYRLISVRDGIVTDCTYKGIGKDASYMFRSYDRNMMNLSRESLGDYTTGDIAGASKDNWVYIRVWDWKDSWKLSVKESGKQLNVTQFRSYDPLYMLLFTQKLTSNKPNITTNMFKVKASSQDSSLEITVTDEYGRSVTEVMKRPKAFDVETYFLEHAD